VFRVDPSVDLHLINDQPHTGLFTMSFPILDQDNCQTIARRMARSERNVKDAKKVKLLRYVDPNLGPRKMPSAEKIDDGKIEIAGQEFVFKLDLESKIVKLQNTNTSDTIDIGDVIVYRV
jgi:leucyl-tRNA synthetase